MGSKPQNNKHFLSYAVCYNVRVCVCVHACVRGCVCSDLFIYLSPVMRKPTFCICENKDADQLRGNREADQRLCFRYLDSMIPLLSNSEISSLWPSSVAVQPGLCRTRSETRMLVFSHRGSFHDFIYIFLSNCLITINFKMIAIKTFQSRQLSSKNKYRNHTRSLFQ